MSKELLFKITAYNLGNGEVSAEIDMNNAPKSLAVKMLADIQEMIESGQFEQVANND